MLLAKTLLLMVPQQLEPAPFPAEVGAAVTVSASRAGSPLPGVEVMVRKPSGSVSACGVTDAAGAVRFEPDEVGDHVFATTIEGVEVLAPLPVTAASRSWWAAFALVPLGSVLLWQNLRRVRGKR